MRPWNLALRFALEASAIAGIGIAAWGQTAGSVRWIAATALPAAAVALWGTFNVPGDPSRSGKAPVQVSGRARLMIELFVFGAGWIAYAIAGHRLLAVGFAVATVVHYVVGHSRVTWLL